MSEPTQAIRLLPAVVGSFVHSAHGASAELARLSAQAYALQPDGGHYQLSKLHLGWSFFLKRQMKKVVFFFWKKRSPLESVFEAKMELDLDTPEHWSERDDEPLTIKGREVTLITPPFLWVGASAADVSIHTAHVTSKADEAVLVRLDGGDVLAAVEPWRESRGRYFVTSSTGACMELLREDGTFTIGPWWRLLRRVENWAACEPDWSSPGIPLTLLENDPNSAPAVILDSMIDAYEQALETATELAPTLDELRESPIPWLTRIYRITNFEAEAEVRLVRDNGKDLLALKSSKTTVEIGWKLRFRIDEDVIEVLMLLTAPGFLVSPACRDPIVDLFQTKEAIEAFKSRLRKGNKRLRKLVDLENVRSFLESALPSAIVVRVSRKPEKETTYDDAYIIGLEGMLSERRVRVLLRARFSVYTLKEDVRAEITHKHWLKVLYFDVCDSATSGLDKKAIEELSHFLDLLRRWVRAVE